MPPASSETAPAAPASTPVIGPTPEWLVHQFDPATDRIAVLRMSETAYRQASFLDQRAIPANAQMRTTDWAAVSACVGPGWRRDAHYIFHIGNVGSTLISRLLGELPGLLAIREPLLLRSFLERLGPLPTPQRWPEGEATERLGVAAALLSRTFRPEQRAIIKATSFTSEIGWRLLPEGSQALFLFATPAHYIENILAGPNSRQALAMLSPSRLARLQTRCEGLSLDLAGLSDARKAALGWACEMTSLAQSEARMPAGTVLWLDFDAFLTDPAAYLQGIARHFGQEVAPATAGALCDGPLMRRYSKALEYEFSPQTRRDILAQARHAEGAAIGDALGWLESLGSRYPAVGQAIRRAGG